MHPIKFSSSFLEKKKYHSHAETKDVFRKQNEILQASGNLLWFCETFSNFATHFHMSVDKVDENISFEIPLQK